MNQPPRPKRKIRLRRARLDPAIAPETAPLVTYALLLLNTVIFAAMWWAGRGDIERSAIAFGAKENTLIRAGQWWRLVTPIFLHGSLTHLIVNGLSLWMFGGQIERIYGSRKYLLIYMVSGILGNVASYLRSDVPSLGASGAIFGLLGAGLVFPIRYRSLIAPEAREQMLRQLFFLTVVNLGFSFLPFVDKWAHFGGFIGGAFCALFLLPEVLRRGPIGAGANRLMWASVVGIVGLLGVVGWCQWHSGRVVRAITVPIAVFTDPGDPWFRVVLPKGWQAAQQPGHTGYRWQRPDGTNIEWADGVNQPDLQTAVTAWLKRNKATPAAVHLPGGQPARFVAVSHPDTLEELCEVTVYNRLIVLTLNSAARTAPSAHNDFQFFLANLRFLRPPKPSRPNPGTAQ